LRTTRLNPVFRNRLARLAIVNRFFFDLDHQGFLFSVDDMPMSRTNTLDSEALMVAFHDSGHSPAGEFFGKPFLDGWLIDWNVSSRGGQYSQ
jgi:hypothetical protein